MFYVWSTGWKADPSSFSLGRPKTGSLQWSLELDRAGVPGANHPKMAHKKAFWLSDCLSIWFHGILESTTKPHKKTKALNNIIVKDVFQKTWRRNFPIPVPNHRHIPRACTKAGFGPKRPERRKTKNKSCQPLSTSWFVGHYSLIHESNFHLKTAQNPRPCNFLAPSPRLAAFAGRFSLCRGTKDGRIPNLTPNVLRAPLGFPDSRWANICAQRRFKSGKVETWGKKCHAIETAQQKFWGSGPRSVAEKDVFYQLFLEMQLSLGSLIWKKCAKHVLLSLFVVKWQYIVAFHLMSFNGFVLWILASLQAASGAAPRTLASARLKDLDRWNGVVTSRCQHSWCICYA